MSIRHLGIFAFVGFSFLSALSDIAVADANVLAPKASPGRWFLTPDFRTDKNNDWNGPGGEPTPTLFYDPGKTKLNELSDLWKYLLKTPEVRDFLRQNRGRVMMDINAFKITSKTSMSLSLKLQGTGVKHYEIENIPRAIVLKQFRSEEDYKDPILPLPLGIYTKSGSGYPPHIATQKDPELLKAFAKIFGVYMTTPAWDPNSETYRSLGTHYLQSIEVYDFAMNMEGRLQARVRATYGDYNMDDVHWDGLRFRMLHVDAPAPTNEVREVSYFPTKAAAGFALDPERPKIFDPIVKVINEVLGPLAPSASKARGKTKMKCKTALKDD